METGTPKCWQISPQHNGTNQERKQENIYFTLTLSLAQCTFTFHSWLESHFNKKITTEKPQLKKKIVFLYKLSLQD
jgi:hypothetical protein